MKRIMSIIKRDMVSAAREKIMVYMLVIPLILAAGAAMVLPSLNTITLTYAVDNSVSEDFAVKLRSYGKVEIMKSMEQLQERVLEYDDVPGIIYEDGQYGIILQGNESDSVKELAGIAVKNIENPLEAVEIEVESLGILKSNIREIMAIMLVVLCIMVAGSLMGLNIVEEKESGGINAYAVSPLTGGQYLLAKGLFSTGYALIASFFCILIILGRSFVIGDFLPLLAVSVFTALVFGLIIGIFADSQVAALAILKALGFLFTLIGLAAFLAPDSLQWIFYPFPNYWLVLLMKKIFMEQEAQYFVTFLVSLLLNVLPIFILMPFLRRKLRLK